MKSVDKLAPIHKAQMITYLKLTGCPVGLLLNFNVPSMRQGIRRLENPIENGQGAPAATNEADIEALLGHPQSPDDDCMQAGRGPP